MPTTEERLTALEARVAALETCSPCALPQYALWSTLYGPAPAEHMLVIDEPVLLDIDATAHGVEVVAGGELLFPADATRILQVDTQHPFCVMPGGTLTMQPASASVRHELRFVGVDESLFTAGGGMDHHANPGLCVDGGTLKLNGTPKRGWTRATAAIAAGATAVTVQDASGWQVGDEVVITPTEPATVALHSAHFDRRTITAVDGNTITFAALTYPHPLNISPSGAVLAAEVANLSRNVSVSGTPTGRAQIMLMGETGALALSHFEGRYLGPRQAIPNTNFTNGVLGRYGLHWHLCGEGSRGTTVDGVSIYDNGFRGFVPHGSHGITFTDCVAWDVFREAYWWDHAVVEDESNDITYDRCFAGRVRYSRPNPEGNGNSGFLLAAGVGNVIRNCVVAGIHGYISTNGYHWPEALNSDPHNVWTFEDNDAHNNQHYGIRIWQNDGNAHDIVRLRTWNNFNHGINHGAYVNEYHFVDCESWGNGTYDFGGLAIAHGGARTVEISGGSVGHVLIGHRAIAGTTTNPNRYVNTTVLSVLITEGDGKLGAVDFINCGITPADVTFVSMNALSVLRIQQGAEAWRLTENAAGTGFDVTSIPLFA